MTENANGFPTETSSSQSSLSSNNTSLNTTLSSPASVSPSFRLSSTPNFVSYADAPYKPSNPIPSFIQSKDIFVLDSDPLGVKTGNWAVRTQQALGTDHVAGLSVFGRAMSREQLQSTEAGSRLLKIAENNRKGAQRGFVDAIFDFEWSDLPFISLFASVGKSVADAVTVSDTLKKLQNGAPVTDDELIKTRLYLAEQEYKSNGSWGATVGDIVRAAPGFMLEFLASGGLYSAARVGASKLAGRGIHLGLTRATKNLADDLVEATARKITAESMERLGTKTAAALNEEALSSVTKVVYANMKNEMNKGLYKGLSEPALFDLAQRRVAYANAKYLSRTQGGKVAQGLHKFGQYLQKHASSAVMDFGMWGTTEASVAYTTHTPAGRALADAMGEFFIKAPIQGAMLWAPNQFVARPLVSQVLGKDGRSVSAAQLALERDAYMTNNKTLMADAEAIASAQNILEYVSESAGAGFAPLMKAMGSGFDKATSLLGLDLPKLVAPLPSKVVRAGARGRLVPEEAGVTVGGVLRKWVDDALGTLDDFKKHAVDRKANIVADALGATGTDRKLVETMVMSGQVPSGLSAGLTQKIGGNATAFIDNAVKAAYEAEKKNGRIKAFVRYTMAEWMNKFNISPQSVMNLYEKMGYDGILGEMFEERYSDVAKGLFGWDERSEDEKGFFENIVQAVKNIWPEGGFAQLTAEAVGFAVPMVTRAFTNRAVSAIGGGGVLSEVQRQLSVMTDALRVDETVEMKAGLFHKLREEHEKQDRLEIEKLKDSITKLEQAQEAGHPIDANKLPVLKAALEQKELAAKRRTERYQETAKSIQAIAQDNMDAMVNVQLWSDQALTSEDYNRRKSYSEEQVRRSATARTALEDFSPVLARRLVEFERHLEGESVPWYRTVSQKLIGFTGGLLTGDFSGMTHNPAQWHAQDYRLSKDVCDNLKKGWREEWERQKKRLTEEHKNVAVERSKEFKSLQAHLKDARRAGDTEQIDRYKKELDEFVATHGTPSTGETFAIPRAEIDDATDVAFANRARKIMATFLQTSQFRSFSQARMKDQAIEHVAVKHGYTYTVTRNESGEETPGFYKLGPDGDFANAGEALTTEQVYEAYKDEVDTAQTDITRAVVDLMTRHSTRGEQSKMKLLALARIPAGAEGIDSAIYDSAVSLLGPGERAHLYQVSRDGKGLRAQIAEASASINMDVVSYIAKFEKYDSEGIDTRAYESIAHAIGSTFTGDEESLNARNQRIHRLARIANAIKDNKVVWFTGSTYRATDHDPRINNGNAFFIKAVQQDDNSYVLTRAISPQTGEPINDEYESLEAMVTALKKENYEMTNARIVFSRARCFEFDDMFTAIRELGLAAEYKRRCGKNLHPMFMRNEDGTYTFGDRDHEDAAFEEVERLQALAANWNSELEEAPSGTSDKDAEEMRKAWERLYHKDSGFITIGEKLLAEYKCLPNVTDKYAGAFSPTVNTRYQVAVNALRGNANSPDIIVPVSLDAHSDVDPATAMINARMIDAYASHPLFLRSVVNGPISEFVHQVSALIDELAGDEELKATDSELITELKAFQRAYCVIDAYDERTKKLKRGARLTPAAFTVFATQFALRRASTSSYNVFSRATAALAPLVYNLPSYIPFMNIVDLMLGGNGFLNEIIAYKGKHEEVLTSQQGIRALFNAIAGEPGAFREAFSSSVPQGMSYTQFLSVAQDNYSKLHLSGVSSVGNPKGAETVNVSKVVSKEFADRIQAEADENSKRLSIALKKAQDTIDNMQQTMEEMVTNKERLTEELRIAKQQLEVARKGIEQIKRDAPEGVLLPPDLQVLYTQLQKDAADAATVIADKTAKIKEQDGDITRAATDAGITILNPRSPIKDSGNEDSGNEDSGNEDSDDVGITYDDDVPYDSAVGSGEFMEDLPSVFERIVDDGELSVVNGVKQAEGRELTTRQARIAVNLGVRAALAMAPAANSTGDLTEGQFLETIKKIFRSVSPEDLTAMVSEFRVLQSKLSAKNLKFTQLTPVAGTMMWVDDEKEEDDVSSDQFNEKSVAQYENGELADFLALAQRVSPETGRNLQALLGNIRESIQYLTSVDPAVMPGPTMDAIKFLDKFINPRGNTKGETTTQRLALFEHILNQFDDPNTYTKIQDHIKNLLRREGTAEEGSVESIVSSKGAFLLSYLMSLKTNARNSFAVLVSNSLVSSAVRERDGVFEHYIRPHERVGENIVINSFSGVVGKSRVSAGAVAMAVSDNITDLLSREDGLIEVTDDNIIKAFRVNGKKIAEALLPLIGYESPLFSALTSDMLARHLALELRTGSEEKKATIKALVQSISKHNYLTGEAMLHRTGIEVVDIILDTLRLLAGEIKSNKGRNEFVRGTVGQLTHEITREEVSAFFTAAFMTGSPLLGKVTRTVNSSDYTSPLGTLMAYYDASLPETVVRADFNPERSKKVSSVAVASRGCIPLGNRFIDKVYDQICNKYFGEAKTDEEKAFRARCKADFTWPDEMRTPIFAKSLSRHLSAKEVRDVCEKSYLSSKKGAPWWVQVYAGDHASSVMIQLPEEAKKWDEFLVIEDTKTKSIEYNKAARIVNKWLGVDLLGADAKRSMVSSLECQGASMIGVESIDTDGTPKFGENRLFTVESYEKWAKNEELKGQTLLFGYGAKQLKAMAKDPESMLLKAHLINAHEDELTVVKSLSVATDPSTGKFAKGTTLRALSDFLEKQVKGNGSTGVLTDRDSAKISPLVTEKYSLTPGGKKQSLLTIISNHYKAAALEKGNLQVTTEELDAWFASLDVYVTELGGNTEQKLTDTKLSQILPGVRIDGVEGLKSPAIAVSYQENNMVGYTVANVSHTSTEPEEAGRTPRNHIVDAWTMASALARFSDMTGIDKKVLESVFDLVADWGITAASVVDDAAFRNALLMSSSSIRELIRNGEDIEGQNIREELIRMINARLKHHLNIPLNAQDAALVTGSGLVHDGKIVDHTKSATRAAMHRGSVWFSKNEAKFYGTDRRVSFCDVNAQIPGLRYSWFLDENKFIDAAHAPVVDPSTGAVTNEDKSWAHEFFQGVTETGDRKFVVALEKMFTSLRKLERSASGREAANALRLRIGSIFKDHHGKYLTEEVQITDGKISDYNAGKSHMLRYAFEDLFRNDSNGERVFDRSAVNIEKDRIELEDSKGNSTPHIVLGGSLFGLPRTPSYNGSMWLQVVRAGLPVTEVEAVDESTGEARYTVGRECCVAPDPWSLEILGCDHDGDKTKMYFYHENGSGRIEFETPPSFETSEALVNDTPELFVASPDTRRRFRKELYKRGMLARKYVDDDGRIHEVDTTTSETYNNEFYDLSEETRKKISNTFVQKLFDMAYMLPSIDENGKDRRLEDARVDFGGGAISRPTGPSSCVGPGNMKNKLLATEGIPNGYLRDQNNNILNTIDDTDTMVKVSDGASDAANARANVVAIMKDLHLAWSLGVYNGKNKLFSSGSDPLSWFNFTYRADGISNSTFDDMKEQICSRLKWRSGMIDVLMTDVLRNKQGKTTYRVDENGDLVLAESAKRGGTPGSAEEFLKILQNYSVDANTENSARWFMDRTTDGTNAEFRRKVFEKFGKYNKYDSAKCFISRDRVAKALGLTLESITGGARAWRSDGTTETPLKKVGRALAEDSVLSKVIDKISGSRGVNFASGYVMFLEHVAKTGDEVQFKEAIADFKEWLTVKLQLEEARNEVSSFNYPSIDMGNDMETGRQADVEETFDKLYEKVVKAERATDFKGIKLSKRIRRMNAAMMASYNAGFGIFTTTARGVMASNGYAKTLAKLSSDVSAAQATARSFLLDRIEAFPGNRLLLQGNTQQVPYVFAALGALPDVQGSVANGTEALYKMLKNMASWDMAAYDAIHPTKGNTLGETVNHWARDIYEDGAFCLRQTIESAYELMYRIASLSDEYKTENNIFAYLGRDRDDVYRTTVKSQDVTTDGLLYTEERAYGYGGSANGLRRIRVKFRANDETSITAIREKAEAVIQGKSFAGKPKFTIGYPAPFTSYNLNYDTLAALAMEAPRKAAKIKDEKGNINWPSLLGSITDKDLANAIGRVYSALKACDEAFSKELKSTGKRHFEITPAMMFGQLLPMYSVLNSRTVGAPVPTSTSLFGVLPRRIYEEISKRQAYNDIHYRDLVNLCIPLNWAPREYATRFTKVQGGNQEILNNARPGWIPSFVLDVENGNVPDATKEEHLKRLYEDARGGDLSDDRSNPSRRNMFDLFAADEMAIEVVRAMGGTTPQAEGTPPDRSTPPGGSNTNTNDPEMKHEPVHPEVAQFAHALGVLTGSWASVDYNGGDSFRLSGKLRGNLGDRHKVDIYVNVVDNLNPENEEHIEALANSTSFASSFCAVSGYKDHNGNPLTVETFMAMSLEVRKAFVRRFQIGGGAANKIAWTLDGRGLATLVGVINIASPQKGEGENNFKGGTVIYHEYFHQMMRMFEALDVFGKADYAELKRIFGAAPKGKNWKFNEEKAAEAFRKWVIQNTTSVKTGVKRKGQLEYEAATNIFKKIYNFLVGLINSIKGCFRIDGEMLFKMAVHGVAQTSLAKNVDIMGASDRPMTDIEIARAIRNRSIGNLGRHKNDVRGRTLYTDPLNPKNKYPYSREDVMNLFPEYVTEVDGQKTLNEAGEELFAAQSRYLPQGASMEARKERLRARNKLSRREAATLREAVEAGMNLGAGTTGLQAKSHAEHLITSVVPTLNTTAEEKDRIMSDLQKMEADSRESENRLISALVHRRDLQDSLGEYLTRLAAMSEKAGQTLGQQVVPNTVQATEETETVDLSVIPGTPENAAAIVNEAIDASTVAKDTILDSADITVTSRVSALIMQAIENGLRIDGSWQASLDDTLKVLGNPKSTDVTVDKAVVTAAVRNVLSVVNPDAYENLKASDIEGSMVFEGILRAYHTLQNSYAKQDAKTPGARVNRSKEDTSKHLSRFSLAGWLLSSKFSAPQDVTRGALKSLLDIRNSKVVTASESLSDEIDVLIENMRSLDRAVQRTSGLHLYNQSYVQDAAHNVISYARAGTLPFDGRDDEPFDEEGFYKNVVIVDAPKGGLATERVKSLEGLKNSEGELPEELQTALKISKTAGNLVSAMMKFFSQTGTVAPKIEDITYNNMVAKALHAQHINDATWLASQSIGVSMLMNDQNLIDFYDQSYFIADNIDAYLSSLVRRSFGGVEVKDAFISDKEFGWIESEILNLENFISCYFGTNVGSAGGRLLQLMEQDKTFKMELGEIVHDTNLGKRLKFDNYHKKLSQVHFTEEDVRTVDLFLKMITAYAQKQRGCVTGVDKIRFSSNMSSNPEFYTKEAIEKRVEALSKGGRSLNKFEEALSRMLYQIPESILMGKENFYNKFVQAACTAMDNANAEHKRLKEKAEDALQRFTETQLQGNELTSTLAAQLSAKARLAQKNFENFDFNTYVLRSLMNDGYLVAHQDGTKVASDGLHVLKTGTLTISCDTIDTMFRSSDTYTKLVDKGGRDPEFMKRENIRDIFMKVYQKAAQFARKHAWLTDGDGKFMNNFGTSLPFFSGTGIFMFAANRVQRSAKRSFIKNLSKYEHRFIQSLSAVSASDTLQMQGAQGAPLQLIDELADIYATPERGEALRDAIIDGKYASETPGHHGLVLPETCTYGDVMDAIYNRFLELAEQEELNYTAADRKRVSDAPPTGDALKKAYAEKRGIDGDMFGGSTGLNDEQMYRLYGVLPANEQIGHKIHKIIDGITNAIMHRNTLVTMMMTPSADGSPVYYVNPSDNAVFASGIPDIVWGQLARWWGKFNGITYDEKLTGVKNAQAMYHLIQAHVTETGGYVRLGGNGDHDKGKGHRYAHLPKEDSDLSSVTDWLVQHDESLGDESSALNWTAGGEAMGYLKHLVQASRVLGFGGPKVRATLHRALSWSKSMSVSFSFFFPIATKWESTTAAVGGMAALASNVKSIGDFASKHPKFANAMQKMFTVGTSGGWVTKDFLGFNDIVEMMDSNDPFLAELIAWAESLGIKISDRHMNPMEPTRGIVDGDLRYIYDLLRDAGHKTTAKRFKKITDFLLTRQSEKAFSYALNATKLATLAQMYMKLKHEAEKRGSTFDMIRDMKQYAGYINAEVGGIDPLKYAWTHPKARGILNSLMFSWEWTRGAWEAGGGNIIEDFLLGGKSITREERNFMFGRWVRMYLAIMIGVPQMIQLFAYIASYMFGGPDDDDTPFTWENEEKTKLVAADLTPFLKAFGESDLFGVLGDKTVAELKKDHPFLLGLLPAYTGSDKVNRKTRNRRIYLHFGKQGWEFFRWFDEPWAQLMSKRNLLWQKAQESFLGYNPGYLDWALPWEDKGALERWLDLSMDGATANLVSTFLPFSFTGVLRMGDAGIINIAGPVQYGASYTNINERMLSAIEAYAKNDRKFYAQGGSRKAKRRLWMTNMLSEVISDARRNGIPPEDIDALVGSAAGQVTNKLYGDLLEVLPEDPSADYDVAKANKLFRAVNRAGAKYASVLSSFKKRLRSRGQEWKKLTPEQKLMYKSAIRRGVNDPYTDPGAVSKPQTDGQLNLDY